MSAAMDLSNPIKPWENVYWTPEPIFRGETVFCIASGPSLTQEAVNKLRGRRIIVVNSSCRLVLRAGISDAVLYFTDSGWYEQRKALVANWPGLVVSMSRQAKRELDAPGASKVLPHSPRILRVKGIGDPSFPPRLPGMPRRPGFPPLGSPEIQQGRNSGNTAVSLAIALGASTVVLLGYDCRVVNGREHHHDEYTGPRDLGLYDNGFLRAFDGWNEAALASGVLILNATPGSAITEFPAVDLDEVLACHPL